MNKLLYTKEHDWIRFDGEVAYIGVTQFKLTGIPKIDNISLFDYREGDSIESGTLLLHLHYRDYIIPLHAPVACTLLVVNPIVTKGLWEWITAQPEELGWLFKVAPEQQENNHLLLPSYYQNRFPSGPVI